MYSQYYLFQDRNCWRLEELLDFRHSSTS
ncbi:unnamed protein product [Linum tenue]|uniref:Maturase K n=1 Tax=Linum tenue TaxID=586396 RepID=A0AAV0NPC1_9ROSI|nr:unnamed protein product [Linum tenue]